MISTIINGKIPGPNGRPIVYDFFLNSIGRRPQSLFFAMAIRVIKIGGRGRFSQKILPLKALLFLNLTFLITAARLKIRLIFPTLKPLGKTIIPKNLKT